MLSKNGEMALFQALHTHSARQGTPEANAARDALTRATLDELVDFYRLLGSIDKRRFVWLVSVVCSPSAAGCIIDMTMGGVTMAQSTERAKRARDLDAEIGATRTEHIQNMMRLTRALGIARDEIVQQRIALARTARSLKTLRDRVEKDIADTGGKP